MKKILDKSKEFNENFKFFYALSLVGQLGFYIAIPIFLAIWGGSYIDRTILDKYFPEPPAKQYGMHDMIIFLLIIIAIIICVWQVYKLILPLMDKDDK